MFIGRLDSLILGRLFGHFIGRFVGRFILRRDVGRHVNVNRVFTRLVARRIGRLIGLFIGRLIRLTFSRLIGHFISRLFGRFIRRVILRRVVGRHINISRVFGRLVARRLGRLIGLFTDRLFCLIFGPLFGHFVSRLFGLIFDLIFGRLFGLFIGRLIGRFVGRHIDRLVMHFAGLIIGRHIDLLIDRSVGRVILCRFLDRHISIDCVVRRIDGSDRWRRVVSPAFRQTYHPQTVLRFDEELRQRKVPAHADLIIPAAHNDLQLVRPPVDVLDETHLHDVTDIDIQADLLKDPAEHHRSLAAQVIDVLIQCRFVRLHLGQEPVRLFLVAEKEFRQLFDGLE